MLSQCMSEFSVACYGGVEVRSLAVEFREHLGKPLFSGRVCFEKKWPPHSLDYLKIRIDDGSTTMTMLSLINTFKAFTNKLNRLWLCILLSLYISFSLSFLGYFWQNMLCCFRYQCKILYVKLLLNIWFAPMLSMQVKILFFLLWWCRSDKSSWIIWRSG